MVLVKVKASWITNSSYIYLIICLFIHYSLQETTTDSNDVTDKGRTDPGTTKKDKEVDKIGKSEVNSALRKSTVSIKMQIRQSKSTANAVANTLRTAQPSKNDDSSSLSPRLSLTTNILNQVNQESTATHINSQPSSSSSTVRLDRQQSTTTSNTDRPSQETSASVGNSKRPSKTISSQRSLLTSSTASTKITTSTVLIRPTPSVVVNPEFVMTSTATPKQFRKLSSEIETAQLSTVSTSSKEHSLQTRKGESSLTKSSAKQSSVQSNLQQSMKTSKPILLKVSSKEHLLQTNKGESSLTKSSAKQSSVQSNLQLSMKTSKPILLKVSSSMGSPSNTPRKILISETVSKNLRETTPILDRSVSLTKTKSLSSFATSFLAVDFSEIVVSGIGKTSSSANDKSLEKTIATTIKNNPSTFSPSSSAQTKLSSLKISKSQTTSSSQTDKAVVTSLPSPTPLLPSATRSISVNTKEQNLSTTVMKEDLVPTSSKSIQASTTNSFAEASKPVESQQHSQEGTIHPSGALSTFIVATPVPAHESSTVSTSRSSTLPNLIKILPLSEHTASSSVSHMIQQQSAVSSSMIFPPRPSESNTPIVFDPSSVADSHQTVIPTPDFKTAALESTTNTEFVNMQTTVAIEALSASQKTVSRSSSFKSQHQSFTPSISFIRVSTKLAREVNSTVTSPDKAVSTRSAPAPTASKTKTVEVSNTHGNEAVTQTSSPKAIEQTTSISKIAIVGTSSIIVIQSISKSSSVTKMTTTLTQMYTPMLSEMNVQTTSVHRPISRTAATTIRILQPSSYLTKDNVSRTFTVPKSSFVTSSSKSLTVTPSLRRSSSYKRSPSMTSLTLSTILATKFIMKPKTTTTTTSILTPKSAFITASKTRFATNSRNYSSAMKSSISPSRTRSTATTVREVYPSSVTRVSLITTIRSTSQMAMPNRSVKESIVMQSLKPSSKRATTTTIIPSVTTATTTTTKTTTKTAAMNSKVTILTTTLRPTTATTTKATIIATTTRPTTIVSVGPTSKEPVTERSTTEQSPTTHHEGTTPHPPVISDPEVHTKKLASFPTAINIHFRVTFPGIEEADRLQIVAQRFDHRVSGNGKILRRWFEVHYFEDYKYEAYVAGEITRKHLVQRKSFNFTIGSDLRCQRAQVRFEHCNGPLHAGSYRVRLMYRVHGIERKGTFSKVYTTATAKPTAKDENTGISQNSITIAVIAVLAVLLVIIVIVAIILYRRKNSQANDHRDTELSDCTLLTSLKRSSSCSKSCYGRGAMTPGDSSLMLKSLTKGMSRPVHVKDFIAWVNRSQADSDFRFAEEFESIRDVGRDQSHEASDLPENRGKNRYVNVLAYDRTRVKLSYTDDEIGSDYINANYIHGYKHPRAYIATQGPLPGTTDDFWRMIWEQNTFNIVMVTQSVERSRVKCHEYWPGTQPTAYGDIIVSLLSEFAFPEWVEREFLVEVEGDGTRQIRHYQYTAWPDHGVPKNAISCLEFIHNVRSYVLPGQGPVVIHCSAGVGRTGTLIAIDTIFDRLQDEDTIDVYLCLCMMRMQRCCMVQTEDQYIFIHRVLVEYLKSREIISPLKGYCLLAKEENAEDPTTPPPTDAPVTNRDSGLAFLLGEYDTERADEALESVA